MKNSHILLLLLVLAVVASLYYTWQSSPTAPQFARDTAGVAILVKQAGNSVLDADRFDFSGGEQRKFQKPRRNLFGQLYPPPPPPKKIIAPTVAPPAPVVVVSAPPPPPMPVPVRAPSSRMPSFQVIGFLEKNHQLTAFVSYQGEIYLVKNEQLFADEFRVAELNQERITIARVTGAGEVSLPLSEKAASMAISGGTPTRSQTPPKRQVSRPRLQPEMPMILPENMPAMPPAHPPIEGGN